MPPPAGLRAHPVTEVHADGFVSAAMVWGMEKEAEALRLFEFEHDVEVTRVGFLDHPTLPMSGASPDGLIGERGLVEGQALPDHRDRPTPADTLLGRSIPEKYQLRVQWQHGGHRADLV